MQSALEDAVWLLDAKSRLLWILALAFFGVGDLLTTYVGFTNSSVVEAGPLVGYLLNQYGSIVMPVMKALALGVCYWVWRTTPNPHNVGVPLGLAVLGVLVTGWNLFVLTHLV